MMVSKPNIYIYDSLQREFSLANNSHGPSNHAFTINGGYHIYNLHFKSISSVTSITEQMEKSEGRFSNSEVLKGPKVTHPMGFHQE